MEKQEEERLQKQLVKLGDILGAGDLDPSERRFYEREYTSIARQLFPEQYSRFGK